VKRCPGFVAAVLLAMSVAAPALAAVPTPEQVKSAWKPSSVQLLDRHGLPLESVRIDMSARRQPWVPLADISPALGRAVMQAEDRRFMEHGGIDLKAAGQAAWDNLFRTQGSKQSRLRGASTITMQLAGLLDPALAARVAGRSWRQKWDQALAARELEAGWSKQQILEAYLNLAGFRGELQGVGAAARGLFGKAPIGLDIGESAILASLLRAPGASTRELARRACALAAELKAASSCATIEWQLDAALSRQGAAFQQAPAQVARLLLEGGSGQAAVRSTVDAPLQRFAAATLRRHLAELAERNVGDGAVLVLDNASGEILAYVANTGTGEVDGVAALRQAGSTLKPFLYELAIERGILHAASLLDDTPVDIPTVGGLYVPQNYDRRYHEVASVRTSLAGSLNIPAVRTLMLTGLERFHARLREVGLSSLTEAADFYGYSLALGSGDVSLLELTNAYRTLASGGLQGSAALRARPPEHRRRVLDERAAFIVADILSDRAARSVTFGLRNELATSFWSAVKTGTSKDMRDNWCVGFTDRYTVGVWVGNFDGRPMWDVSGVTGAAPVWRDVVDYLHRDRPSRAPAPPSSLVRQAVAFTPAVEPPRGEWFVRGTETASVQLLAPGQRQPKIVYPADASLIALDPDIPARLQRLRFQAQGGSGLAWVMDGVELEAAALEAGWAPVPGKHELQLVGRDGRPVANARFEVRGEAQLVSSFSTSSGGSSARAAASKATSSGAPEATAAGTNSGESER
jgi:penicillin-binding protein 1C